MARRLVEIARMEGASAIAHGCTGVHNDQVRLEASIRALDPSLADDRRRAGLDMPRPTRRSSIARQRRVAVPDAGGSHVQHRHQSLGPRHRLRRAGRRLGRAARGHLHADALAAGEPRSAGVRRARLRGRRAGAGQRRRHVDARADREPRNHRRRARRRPNRRRREPARRHQGARGLRSARRGRPAHGAQGAREAGDSARSRAREARPEPHLRRSRLQRPVVLAHARRRSTPSSRRCSRASPARSG